MYYELTEPSFFLGTKGRWPDSGSGKEATTSLGGVSIKDKGDDDGTLTLDDEGIVISLRGIFTIWGKASDPCKLASSFIWWFLFIMAT